MPDLYRIASTFRTAIEEAVRCGEIKETATFPYGCCGFASDLLQRFLFEKHIFTWYVSGRYGYGWSGESHAWLETRDGTVVDITGDQYKHKKPCFNEPVYVGERSDGFHDQFDLDPPVAYQFGDNPIEWDQDFDCRYRLVMRHME